MVGVDQKKFAVHASAVRTMKSPIARGDINVSFRSERPNPGRSARALRRAKANWIAGGMCAWTRGERIGIQSLLAEPDTEAPARLERIGGFVSAPECSNARGEVVARNGA